MGTHAGVQSRQLGQLDVAHSLQVLPALQPLQNPGHDAAHSPVLKMHTLSSPQSS